MRSRRSGTPHDYNPKSLYKEGPAMKKTLMPLLVLVLIFTFNYAALAQGDGNGAAAPKPPMAERKTKTTQIHGDTMVDDFFWLREKTNPQVIAYLESENSYTEAAMKHTAALQEKLYKEMVGHIKETDENLPYRQDGYYYYSRTVKGLQYPIYARKHGSLDAKEEITLDMNEMAKGLKFLGLGAYAVSDDGNYLAYTTDTTGYRPVSYTHLTLPTSD